jgi:hypothetical protein
MSQGGHIVKPSGKRKTWAIIYRDPAGIQQWEGKFKKRTEAQSRLNEVLGAIDKGTYARPSSVTFEKFAEDWLAGRRLIRGSTESGYGSIINKQLVPRFGAIAVSALRFDHIDAAVSGMIEDELSSKTMEARRVPGLYFIGEVVDVTGWLGGYNFQWAWASGHAAGQAV